MALDIDTMTDHEREAFWITNLRAALAMMLLKDDEAVGLATWRSWKPGARYEAPDSEPTCGTIACFGGWLPYDSHFADLGVTAHPYKGYPKVYDQELDLDIRDFEVAGYLFGDEDLFDSRKGEEWFLEVSDREIVIKRITNRMRQLGVEA